MNIAIDGPAGAGKSTVARAVAERMNYIYVDTGAMYRAIAVYFLINSIDINDEKACEQALDRISVTIAHENGVQKVFLNGVDISPIIRTEPVSHAASLTSSYAPVRKKLLSLQQELAKTKDVVMDGRDIGTVVLPDAEVKIYLTASVRIRALRRLKEYEAKGLTANLQDMEHEIEERDKRDMGRANAPLKQAEDAHFLDSTDLSVQEVTDRIISLIPEKQ